MLPAAAIYAMRQALQLMSGTIESGQVLDRTDLLVGIEEIMALVGDDEVAKLEAKWLLTEQIDHKYR